MSVLVTQPAPDFTAAAAMPDGSIKEDFKLSDLRGKYVVLFFWPLDFTFVCPSEIIAHDHRIAKFKELGVEVVGSPSIRSLRTMPGAIRLPKRAALVRYSSPWLPTSSMKLPRLTALNIRPASPCAVPS